MQDVAFIAKCNHKIQNYKLDIVMENGKCIARLPFPPVLSPALIYIRSWDDEREYMESIKSYEEVQSYAFYNSLGTNAKNVPPQGPNAIIGIQSYRFLDPYTIEFVADDQGKLPVDVDPDLVPKPLYLIDFTVDPKNCPRCTGTGVIKDVYIEDTGSARIMTGKDKIKQQVVKALITPLGWDLSDPSYGSELSTLIGKAVTDDIRVIMQTTIIQCVQHLITIQPADLDDDETITSVAGITIEDISAGNGHDAFAVRVLVTNRSGDTIDCSVAFNLD